MEIKVVKEGKATDYTFIDKNLELGHNQVRNESAANRDNDNSDGNDSNNKTKTKADYRLRDTAKLSKIRGKSKVTGGGHSSHSHSPVYE